MLLADITNAILETVRAAHIVDDERIDLRLIGQFVKAKRALYAQSIIDSGKSIPEQFAQYLPVDLVATTSDQLAILTTTTDVPKMLSSRFGPAIIEVASTSLQEFPFRVVNNSYFRVVGSGKFNTKFIFVTYRDNNLLFKSRNVQFLQLKTVMVKAVLEDPESYPDFDQDTDDFPIDMQCFDYIKDEVVKNDIRLLMAGISDEVNDSTGEIKQ